MVKTFFDEIRDHKVACQQGLLVRSGLGFTTKGMGQTFSFLGLSQFFRSVSFLRLCLFLLTFAQATFVLATFV